MRTPIVAFILAMFASTAAAQTPTPTPAPEVYTLNAGSTNVGNLIQVIRAKNEKLCSNLHRQAGTNPWTPAWTCTQAQACTVASAPGGASCTAAQARGANVRVWLQTEAGHQEYVMFQIVLPAFNDQVEALPSWEQRQQCIAFNAGDQNAKDQMCINAGRVAPCRLYGPTCF